MLFNNSLSFKKTISIMWERTSLLGLIYSRNHRRNVNAVRCCVQNRLDTDALPVCAGRGESFMLQTERPALAWHLRSRGSSMHQYGTTSCLAKTMILPSTRLWSRLVLSRTTSTYELCVSFCLSFLASVFPHVHVHITDYFRIFNSLFNSFELRE